MVLNQAYHLNTWVIGSHKCFFLLFLIGKNRNGIGKKGGYFFFIGNGAEIRPLEKGRKYPFLTVLVLIKYLSEVGSISCHEKGIKYLNIKI